MVDVLRLQANQKSTDNRITAKAARTTPRALERVSDSPKTNVASRKVTTNPMRVIGTKRLASPPLRANSRARIPAKISRPLIGENVRMPLVSVGFRSKRSNATME